MTNPKEVLEHIEYKKQKEAKLRRKLAILAFDRLVKDARKEFCCHEKCLTCIYRIEPDSSDYVDLADGKNCYARRFHEDAIAMLMKKEGIS